MSNRHGRTLVNGGAIEPDQYQLTSGTTPVPLYNDGAVGAQTVGQVHAGQHLVIDAVYILNPGDGTDNLELIFRNALDTTEIVRFGAPDDHITHPINGLWRGIDASNIEMLLSANVTAGQIVRVMVSWHVVTPTSVG